MKKEGEEQDLYKHTVKVMNHLINHSPHDALNKFEEVSYILKNKNLSADDFLKTYEWKEYSKPSDESMKNATCKFIDDTKKYFKVSLNNNNS